MEWAKPVTQMHMACTTTVRRLIAHSQGVPLAEQAGQTALPPRLIG